jgi:hypothetical protein
VSGRGEYVSVGVSVSGRGEYVSVGVSVSGRGECERVREGECGGVRWG